MSRLRAVVFSSETRDWVIHPWMEIGGEFSMMDSASTLVGGYIYRPLYGEGRAIRINTATMDVSSLYLPSLATDGDSMVGDTEDGKLCMVYASTDDLLLHVWIRSRDGDGMESWVLQYIISLRAEIDVITPTPWEWQDQVTIVEVRSTEHEAEGSCSCLLKSSNSTKIKTPTNRIAYRTGASPAEGQGDTQDQSKQSRGGVLMVRRLLRVSFKVKLLFEEKRALEEANKRLLCLLEKEQKHRSERKHSASNPTKQKRKSSSPVGLAIDFNTADASRQPSHQNSPYCRVHNK